MTSLLLAAALAASTLAPQSHPMSSSLFVSLLVDESVERGFKVDIDFGALIEPSARQERWAHAAIAAHIVAQFADVGTTLYSLGRFGCDSRGRSLTTQTVCFKEANPLLRWSTRDPALHAVVKGVVAAGTSYALLKMHKKRPKAAIATAAVSAALTAYVAHRNAEQIRRHQK